MQQFFENGSFVNVFSGVAGFEELFDNVGADAVGFQLYDAALGGDGKTIGIDVYGGVHLSFR